MEITWLGHSSVCINSRDEILITDPFDTSHNGMMPSRKSDIVTVSNSDPKYSTTKAISGNPYIVNGPGEYEIGQYYITGIATPLTETTSEDPKINVIYTIRAEGLVICQLGGLNQKLTSVLVFGRQFFWDLLVCLVLQLNTVTTIFLSMAITRKG